MIGIKTPLMNTNGNLITLDNRTTSAGVSVGRAEKIVPRDEKLQEIKGIKGRDNKTLFNDIPKIKPMRINGNANRRPNNMEANISPISTISTVIGLESSISSVLCLVSQGAIIGVTDEAAKKSVKTISEARPSFNSRPFPA